jgi:2-amino-4-hydroxy-6-hydroxymethyldihydropteridine diphosphokinase
MARCLIGCGSNLGSRREQLDRAIELLRYMPGVVLRAVSRYRETRPVGGPPGQTPFLNGACLVETDLEPRDVLGLLAAVENTLHRDRGERWSARTMDLDLLLYDDVVVESETLTVPHPRMATRRFVLEPAVEIAPDLPHPIAGCTLRDLLDTITAPCPFVAVAGVPGSGAPEVAAAVADATMARLVRAPLPPPLDTDEVEAWLACARGWADTVGTRPPARTTGRDDCGVAIADAWMGCLAVAAEDLPAEARRRFDDGFAAVLAETVVPHAVILLRLDAATIADRMAFRTRPAARHSHVFADVVAVRGREPSIAPPEPPTAALLRLQERLVRRLCRPGERLPGSPRAVIVVEADDPVRATDEAIAAVEAML